MRQSKALGHYKPQQESFSVQSASFGSSLGLSGLPPPKTVQIQNTKDYLDSIQRKHKQDSDEEGSVQSHNTKAFPLSVPNNTDLTKKNAARGTKTLNKILPEMTPQRSANQSFVSQYKGRQDVAGSVPQYRNPTFEMGVDYTPSPHRQTRELNARDMIHDLSSNAPPPDEELQSNYSIPKPYRGATNGLQQTASFANNAQQRQGVQQYQIPQSFVELAPHETGRFFSNDNQQLEPIMDERGSNYASFQPQYSNAHVQLQQLNQSPSPQRPSHQSSIFNDSKVRYTAKSNRPSQPDPLSRLYQQMQVEVLRQQESVWQGPQRDLLQDLMALCRETVQAQQKFALQKVLEGIAAKRKLVDDDRLVLARQGDRQKEALLSHFVQNLQQLAEQKLAELQNNNNNKTPERPSYVPIANSIHENFDSEKQRSQNKKNQFLQLAQANFKIYKEKNLDPSKLPIATELYHKAVRAQVQENQWDQFIKHQLGLL